jgi:hypothetical protein
MRGTPWYARRDAPPISTTSPERSRSGVGAMSRVGPPIKKTQSSPSEIETIGASRNRSASSK